MMGGELNLQPGPQLQGAKGGGALLNKNLPPTKLPSMPTQTSLSLAAVSRWWLFCGNQQRTRRKVDQIGAMTFVFLQINRELGEN